MEPVQQVQHGPGPRLGRQPGMDSEINDDFLKDKARTRKSDMSRVNKEENLY